MALQEHLQRLLPLALLYLQHWHPPLVAAAHSTCAALLQRAPQVQPTWSQAPAARSVFPPETVTVGGCVQCGSSLLRSPEAGLDVSLPHAG